MALKPIPPRKWFWLICEIISKRYIEGNGWKTIHYHYDGLGSVRQLTDKNGKIKGEYDYLPFGKVIGIKGGEAKKNQFTFTGREYDSNSGLYYYRARYMDPRFGRYITNDPIGFKGGINKYSYCLNNPIRYVDYDGTDAVVLNDSNGGIFSQGHSAIAIGNIYTGWNYYSKEGYYTSDGGYNVYRHYGSYSEMMRDLGIRYDRSHYLFSSTWQDSSMMSKATYELTTGYSVFNNCSVLVNNVLRVGNFSTLDDTHPNRLAIPNQDFDYIIENNSGYEY